MGSYDFITCFQNFAEKVTPMSFGTNVGKCLIPKTNEQVSGDAIEVFSSYSPTAVVLADGIGSGTRANDLSTLTAKTAIQMVKCGHNIAKIVETLDCNLSACEKSNTAYSTFSILQVFCDGSVYLAEYDNPPAIIGHKHYLINIQRNSKIICGKRINEAHFKLNEGSWIVLISDGVLHIGMENPLSFRWNYQRVKNYISRVITTFKNPQEMCDDLCHVCKKFSGGKITDDISVAAVMIQKRR